MRLEYNEQEEAQLRITEIQAILENNLYEDEQDEKCLVKEQEELIKIYGECIK